MEHQLNEAIIELVEAGKMAAFWRSGRVVIKETGSCTPEESRMQLSPQQWRAWLREENFREN